MKKNKTKKKVLKPAAHVPYPSQRNLSVDTAVELSRSRYGTVHNFHTFLFSVCLQWEQRYVELEAVQQMEENTGPQ